jgi:hypothetical protein
MGEHYCSVHGEYSIFLGPGGCPACKAAELRSMKMNEQLLEMMAEQARKLEEADKRNSNYEVSQWVKDLTYKHGDFFCPRCKHTSLMYGDKRCYTCGPGGRALPSDFWDTALEKKQEFEKLIAERRKRDDEMRQKQFADTAIALKQRLNAMGRQKAAGDTSRDCGQDV